MPKFEKCHECMDCEATKSAYGMPVCDACYAKLCDGAYPSAEELDFDEITYTDEE